MEYRALGKTGFQASRIGAGDLADRSQPLERCVATLQQALAWGVNVVDTAPGYEDGFSEEIVGAAVQHQRDRVFVISKIDDIGAPLTPQLEASLRRLQMGYLDGYVYHGLSDMAQYHQLRHGEHGFTALHELKARGLVRAVGISSHHPEMLMQALQDGVCDLVMFSVGAYVDPRYIDTVLPAAKARGVATVCFKTFGAGKLVTDTTGYGQPLVTRPRGKRSTGEDASAGSTNLSVADCVRYTLTCDPDVALLGMSFPAELEHVRAAYAGYVPASHDEMADIRLRAAIARADKGPCWWNPDPDA